MKISKIVALSFSFALGSGFLSLFGSEYTDIPKKELNFEEVVKMMQRKDDTSLDVAPVTQVGIDVASVANVHSTPVVYVDRTRNLRTVDCQDRFSDCGYSVLGCVIESSQRLGKVCDSCIEPCCDSIADRTKIECFRSINCGSLTATILTAGVIATVIACSVEFAGGGITRIHNVDDFRVINAKWKCGKAHYEKTIHPGHHIVSSCAPSSMWASVLSGDGITDAVSIYKGSPTVSSLKKYRTFGVSVGDCPSKHNQCGKAHKQRTTIFSRYFGSNDAGFSGNSSSLEYYTGPKDTDTYEVSKNLRGTE